MRKEGIYTLFETLSFVIVPPDYDPGWGIVGILHVEANRGLCLPGAGGG